MWLRLKVNGSIALAGVLFLLLSTGFGVRIGLGDGSPKAIVQYGRATRALGAQTTIVILVEFSDVKHTHSKEQIHELIIGKMNAYATEVSYNQTWFVGNTTSKWYQLPNPLSHYSPWPGRVGEPNWDRQRQFVLEVIRAADAEVDFSQYKRVIIVHAGSGGFPPYEMGVSWYHCCPEWSSVRTNDGVTINDLVVDAEVDPPSVVVHEWLHYLGGYENQAYSVKDLYDWDLLARGEYAGIYVGKWDLMSGQWWDEPQGIGSWTKLRLGWLPASHVAKVKPSQAVTLQIDALEVPSTGIQAVSMALPNGKYYLAEVREKIGYDSKLPDNGMLLTLCDDRVPSGKGPVKVQDADPSTSTLDDATFDLRAGKQLGFFDEKNDVSIVVTGKSGLSYTIFVGPVSEGAAVQKRSEKSLAATVAIQNANSSIRTAQLVGRTEGLENARSLLLNASDALQRENFDTALALAQKSREAADSATYPEVWYEAKELFSKAGDLSSRASASSFTSAEAQAIVRQASSAYDSAREAFVRNDFDAARDYAQTAVTLFERAFSVEQDYREVLQAQQRQTFNYTVIGAILVVILGVLAAYAIRKRARNGLGKQ